MTCRFDALTCAKIEDNRAMLALAINPMGKVPVLRTDDGDMLSDWGAILFYFAFGTPLWPHMRRDQAEVLSWMFFEQ